MFNNTDHQRTTTMDLQNHHIVVVGGAIGGSAAALLLARAGARVTLLEKVARPRAVGAGIAIAENGMAVFEALGLAPALTRHAVPATQARIVDGRGATLIAPPSPSPRVLLLRRSTLHTILLDAVAAEPRITPMFGAEMKRATSDGHVIVDHDGEERVLKGDLVIGADGLHSRLRGSAAFGARLTETGITYLRGLIPSDLARNEEAWTSAGIFGSFRVDGGTYFYGSAGSPASRRAIERRDLAMLADAWREAYPAAAEMIASLPDWGHLLLNEVVRVDCARWYDGRLVLLGDAAHAMAPNLGQGANSALVDAAVLLDELRSATKLEEALGRYDARRRPSVRRVADTAGRLGRIAEVTNGSLRWMRDRLLLPIASRLTGGSTTAMVMQEPRELLAAVGRASR